MPKKVKWNAAAAAYCPKTEQRQFGNNPFAVPHDAASTVGYVFKSGGSKCTYLTDVGFVTDEVRQNIADADVVVLEANHDEDMLKNGSYPQILKQRILGTRGHLSNVSAAWLLAHMERLPEEVFLAHLSQENNLPSLALQTVRGYSGR